MNPKALFDKAKITKWPHGTHYYVKLSDGRDVVIDGKMKWSTYREAQDATKKFLGLN